MVSENRKELINELRKSWNLQSSMFELGKRFQEIRDTQQLFDVIGEFCIDQIGAYGCLIIKNVESDRVEFVYANPSLESLHL